MRRSAAPLETRASARDARRAQDVPSRNDRALPRQSRRSCALVRAGAAAQPAVLARSGRRSRGGTHDEATSSSSSACHLRCSHRLQRRLTRSATSRSTASAGSRSPATASTCVYVLDLAEIPTFQARPGRRCSGRTHGGSRWDELTVDGHRARLVAGATALAHPVGAGGLRDDAARGAAPRSADQRLQRRSSTATRTTRIESGGRRSSSERTRRATSDELRAYPKDLLREPARRHDSVQATLAPTSDPPPTLDARRVAGGARPRRRLRVREADRPRATSASGHARLARRGALLGSGARAVARSRQVDRHGVPRRAARHAWHAALLGLIVTATHTVGVFTLGLRHARAVSVRRSGPPVSVAEPRLGTAGGRRSASRCSRRAGGTRAHTRTVATIITTTTTGTKTRSELSLAVRRRRVRRTASVSHPRSSCCSPRSRCTESRSACC